MTLTADDLRRAATLSLYRRNFETYASQQLKLQTKQVGSPTVPFVLNPAQRLANAVAERQLREKGRIRMVILKGRQNGMSAWSSGRGFHVASLLPNIQAFTVAHDDATSARIFGYSKLYYELLAPEIRPLSRYSNKEELVFENPDPRTRSRWPGLRSRINFATAKNAQSGTGHTNHVVHASEVAKYGPNVKEMWTSLKPSIPDVAGSMVILESTAHFSGQWFREFCDRAQHPQDEYEFLFLPWMLTQEYTDEVKPGEMQDLDDEERFLQQHYALSLGQLKWRRARVRELGNDPVARKLFQQEYPLEYEEAWIDMEMGVFDARALMELGQQIRAPLRVCQIFDGPRLYDSPDGALSIWEEPQPGELYDLAIDVGSGSETGDWSVGQVMKRRTREQVAEWRGKIGVLDLAKPMYWLGLYYMAAQMAPEVDGLGIGLLDRLVEMGYPNLYLWRKHGTALPKITRQAGWHTSYESKKKLVTRGRHYIAHKDVIIHSPILYNELREFSIRQTEQREFYEGSGKHDDCVLSWLIALTIGLDEALIQGPQVAPPPTRPMVHREPGLHDDFWNTQGGTPADLLAATLRGDHEQQGQKSW